MTARTAGGFATATLTTRHYQRPWTARTTASQTMTTNRPTWDEYFTGIAEAVSVRASCPRASVGAVLVSEDHRVLSTGYNGAPAGEPDCLEAGCDLQDEHCQRALHAEVNAVAFAARHGVPIRGARIYVTGKAICRECSKVLRAAGVRPA